MEIAIINRPSRILSGHLWVFSNELVQSPKRFRPGSLLELRDRKDNFLGIGYVNPNSLISIRILTRKNEPVDRDFFKRRVLNALNYRKRFIGGSNSFRAVFSEGDYLPGLIVDKFEDCLSVQFLTLGMEALSDTVINVLDEVFSPEVIVLRNDSQARTLEGIPLEKKIVKGGLDKLPVIREGDISFEVDPISGQKTGFFLDQAENRAAFSSLVDKGEGLDLFCHTGAWSIRLGARGAKVRGVDASETAILQAKKNAELNDLQDNCEFIKADVLEFIKEDKSRNKKYDFIVLDPPAFVKSKAKIREGLRAYRELNASVMGLLKEGGLLATSSCSYHVDKVTFLETLRAAAKDSNRPVRVVEMRHQAKDHPISLAVPETEYLKCVILEVS